MKSFRIDWDKDYGVYHKKGWSIFVDGNCLIELRPCFIVAGMIALWRYLRGYKYGKTRNKDGTHDGWAAGSND